jgi:hypothetical protein
VIRTMDLRSPNRSRRTPHETVSRRGGVHQISDPGPEGVKTKMGGLSIKEAFVDVVR